MLTAGGVTHPGRVRPINEDSFFSDPDEGLFIVADGMGGHHAGEVASSLAVESVRTFMMRTRDGDDMTWPYGIDPNLSFDANRVITAIRVANRRVFKAGESREDYSGMGTTIVVALVTREHKLVFAGVGDSRIYVHEAGRLEQITKDDSWVSMMLGKESIDPSAIAKHPMRHVLTNVVGARDQIDLSVMQRDLGESGALLLSTDGLHESIDRSTLEAVLAGGDGTPEQQADHLVQTALERGSTDNVTALIVRYRR
jgi:protein phosphatase